MELNATNLERLKERGDRLAVRLELERRAGGRVLARNEVRCVRRGGVENGGHGRRYCVDGDRCVKDIEGGGWRDWIESMAFKYSCDIERCVVT